MITAELGTRRLAAISIGMAISCAIVWFGFRFAMPRHPVAEISNSIVDFGIVGNDEVVTREISILNRGQEPLIIDGLNLSCGCVEAVAEHTRIDAGKSEKIVVSVRARPGRFGRVEEFMVVLTNSPVTPTVHVAFEYFSGRGIRFTPDSIDAGRIDRGNLPKLLSVRIDASPDLGLDRSELRLKGAVNQWILSELIHEGSTSRLNVTIESNHPSGQFSWLVPLEIPSRGEEYQIGVHGNIRGQIFALPPSVVIGPVDPGKAEDGEASTLHRIQLKTRAAEPLAWTAKFDDTLGEVLCCSIDSSVVSIRGVTDSWRRFGRTVVRGTLFVEAKFESAHSEQLSIPVTLVLGTRKSQF